MKKRLPITISIILLLILLAATVIASLSVGVADISLEQLLHSPILWKLRMPRVLLAATAGAALATSGAVYQSVFRNPLTDPYVLGISSGASLGAALAILLGLEAYLVGVGAAALTTALLTMLLLFKTSTRTNRIDTNTLLLTGVCMTFLITAVISLLMALRHDKMESIIFWTMGSFSSASWLDLAILLPVTMLCLVPVLYHRKDLNLLLTGADTAQSLGLDVEKVRRRLLITTTLMVAFTVSACGVIGFVGLVVPHVVRLVAGTDNRRLIPLTILTGAIFLLLCDTLARILIPPNELPVGSITSLIGAPMFIYLLHKNHR